MKEIERKDSPQREIAALLGANGPMTAKQIAFARGTTECAARQTISRMVKGGYIEAASTGRRNVRFKRTCKPLPPIGGYTLSQLNKLRQQRERAEARRAGERAPDVQSVFSAWRSAVTVVRVVTSSETMGEQQ